jgi:microsomal dipeptidase-like Zn-dependent dipeptidase
VRKIAAALVALAFIAVVLFFTAVAPIVDRRMNRIADVPLPPVSERAAALHRELTIVDLHADPLLWSRDLLDRAGHGHVDLPRLAEGNVALQVFSTVTKSPRGLNYERNDSTSDQIALLAMAQRWPVETWGSLRARALHQARTLGAAARRSRGRLHLVRTVRDLDSLLAVRERDRTVVGALLSIEGAHALEGQLENIDTLHAAGVRMMGLTHFFDNELGGSSAGVEKGGLTPFGRDAVARMEASGIIVDLAHASPRLIDDVLGVATRPVVVSHTGVRATCDSPRNLSDDQLRRIAATGGVIGIGYWDGAICDIAPASFARAVLHAVRVAGVDHVALGSDFDGATTTAFDASGLAQVTEALLGAGLSPDDIAAIAGRNALRVLRATLPP